MTQRPPVDFKLQRSSRDATDVPTRIAEWLATVVPGATAIEVVLGAGVDSSGMSSETMLIDASWILDGQDHAGRYVARVAPAPGDLPVFPSYALQEQYDVIGYVGEHTDVPVPTVHWIEPTGTVLGTPFFLMDRVEGVVPPDVLPYTFGDNWLFDARPEEQQRLQDSTIAAIAGLHAVPDPARHFDYLDAASDGHHGATPLLRNLARTRAWYEFAVADVGRSPTVERALAWLQSTAPDTDDEPVLCWGDSRIGNVIYRDFEPVAVLDWEMATLGAREQDVSWLVFAHRVFETIAHTLELPGMPEFLREDDVTATYLQLTGVALRDLTWFHVHCAVQWSIVFMRTGARQIHFGEIARPDDLETLFHHKPLFDQLLGQVGA